MSPLLLLGAGGHTRSCIDVIEQEGRFKISGLVGLPEEVGKQIFGYSVIGSDSDLESKLHEFKSIIITVGQIKTPDSRIDFFHRVKKIGYELPTIISPHAYVSPHARLGKGNIIMHGAVINADVVIGNNCIINSQSLIEHGAVINDHCHISTAVIINGEVNIGEGSFIGSNSSIREGVNVGARCLIGMGQRVFSDCETGSQLCV